MRRSIPVLTAAVCLLVWSGPARSASVSVRDSVGRTITITPPVRRIACLYAFSGHAVAMLGRADAIVAVSKGLQRDTLFAARYPAIARAAVPRAQGMLNIEELAATRPDIVFVSLETYRNEAERHKLDACGLPWLVVHFSSMQEQQHAVSMIGDVIDASARARDYISYYQACLHRVQAGQPDSRPRVYYVPVEPLLPPPTDSLTTDWLRAIGADPVFSGRERQALAGKNYIGIEQVCLWNPDIILVNEPAALRTILNDRRWQAVSALRSNRVYQMPTGISRWGHPGSLETPLALLWAARTMFPDQFNDIDLPAELRTFYRHFFSITVDQHLTRRILQGTGMRQPKHRRRTGGSRDGHSDLHR